MRDAIKFYFNFLKILINYNIWLYFRRMLWFISFLNFKAAALILTAAALWFSCVESRAGGIEMSTSAVNLNSASKNGNGAEYRYDFFRRFNLSRIVGMVYDKKTSFPVKNCEITIGSKKIKTDKNGYFEMDFLLEGEYLISAFSPSYEQYTDIIKIKAPLSALKIYLYKRGVKISESQKANHEYDRLLSKIISGPANNIIINGDGSETRKKPSYKSKAGAKRMIEEDSKGRSYSKKTDSEVSKAPKISTARGFGLMICSVRETGGAPVEADAKIIIGTQSILTKKSEPVEIHNVPVGSYKIIIKCEGYKDKIFERINIGAGENKKDFFIDKN